MTARAPKTVITVPSSPLVTIFVRHSAGCTHVGDSTYKRCHCRKSLRYFHDGKQRMQSAKTRSWALAEDAKRKLEDGFRAGGDLGDVVLEVEAKPTIERSVNLFLSDKKSQGLDDDVIKKYHRELTRFVEFMKHRSRHFPAQIRLEDLTEFRAGWLEQYPSSTTRGKVQERLRAFLRYCYESKLMDRVPKLSAIKVDEVPTIPLSAEQYQGMLDAVPEVFTGAKAIRVRALIRLMRYCGLAIRDAVTLERTELRKGATNSLHRIDTSRQKTGTHVSVPIPTDVAEEVIAAAKLNANPKYIFWNTGTGTPQTAVTNWQHDLREVFRAAGQPDGHPHQLRDTFAVWLLEKGVPLEEVSKALGHTSIKTTERYYAKWVKARQDRLDTLITGAWGAPASEAGFCPSCGQAISV